MPILDAAAIAEPEAGSLIVPELAKVVFTVSVLLPMFNMPEASVIWSVLAVRNRNWPQRPR